MTRFLLHSAFVSSAKLSFSTKRLLGKASFVLEASYVLAFFAFFFPFPFLSSGLIYFLLFVLQCTIPLSLWTAFLGRLGDWTEISAYNFRGKLSCLVTENSWPWWPDPQRRPAHNDEYFDYSPLEDHNWKIYQKPSFMFRDAVPDTNHQLLARKGQWIFTLNGETYYLPSSKRHFSLSFF